jgi:hypothetical protein
MISSLEEIACASLPLEALATLAELRCLSGVEAAVVEERAWVRWQPGEERVLRRLLAVSGVELFVRRDGRWYRLRCHLPAFDVPDQIGYRPLYLALVPAPIERVAPSVLKLPAVPLCLVPDDRQRRATALACRIRELERWADGVPSSRLAALRAARCGEWTLVLGDRLPLLPRGERFWGKRVLVPLGYRPEPHLPESALCQALGLAEDERLLFGTVGAEIIAQAHFQPLDRAGLRLASRDTSP